MPIIIFSRATTFGKHKNSFSNVQECKLSTLSCSSWFMNGCSLQRPALGDIQPVLMFTRLTLTLPFFFIFPLYSGKSCR